MTWFEPLGDHMGKAYLRYSFTKGTQNEVGALIELLEISPGDRVLDVGCGPGRHAISLAERGFHVVGLDISAGFVGVGNEAAEQLTGPGSAHFRVADARGLDELTDLHGQFDAVISLCQGAFGMTGGPGSNDQALVDGQVGMPARELDESIVVGMVSALKPGGALAVSAFSAYFQLRYLEDSDAFDAINGVNHELTEVRNSAGEVRPADLWTTCYTPRELRLLARLGGLEAIRVYSVTPGAYETAMPTTESPEFLLRALKPAV